MKLLKLLTDRPWTLAFLVLLGVVAWFASGLTARRAAGPEATADSAGVAAPLTRVQVRAQTGTPVARIVSVYGRTKPARTVQLKAETDGRVETIGLPRGAPARRGELLLKLDLRDRQARLEQARASVNEHQTAYAGQLELKAESYVSETQIAETLAKLEAARTELKRAELDLEHMSIRAPFDGIILDRVVEAGDYVKSGDAVATFVDNTSVIVTGSVAEQDVARVTVGKIATARLATGQEARGRVRYVSPVADEATRTFTVELELPNPDGQLPAGVTAEMRIQTGEVLAHRVSPSLLTLATDGRLGVQTVDADGEVEFHAVEIARSEPNGVWVTGLPETANVIIVGQGYVSAGQRVAPVPVEPETALAAEQL